MRRSALLLAATVLIAGPAVAANIGDAPAVSFATCSQPFSCAAYAGLMSGDPKITGLISQANSCVGRFFGLGGSNSYFKSERGLDSNGCLASEAMPKSATGGTLTPHCCVTPSSGDNCQLRCDLRNVR